MLGLSVRNASRVVVGTGTALVALALTTASVGAQTTSTVAANQTAADAGGSLANVYIAAIIALIPVAILIIGAKKALPWARRVLKV